MDPEDIFWVDFPTHDSDWETSYRRDFFEDRPLRWSIDSSDSLADIGDWEASGDDIARRERMAQAMYDL